MDNYGGSADQTKSLLAVLSAIRSARSTRIHLPLESQITPLVALMKSRYPQIIVARTTLSKFFPSKKNCS